MHEDEYKAVLVLEDGKCFYGKSIFKHNKSFGELCFTTGVTGYQESITDPSYCGQILVFTAPHIGNTGVNSMDHESTKLSVSGVVMREKFQPASSWRSEIDIKDWFIKNNTPVIYGIDTRSLTQYIVRNGHQNAAIVSEDEDLDKIIEYLNGGEIDLSMNSVTDKVSADKSYEFTHTLQGYISENKGLNRNFNVVVLDFGVKYNILRHLKTLGFNVFVVPYLSSYEHIMSFKPDGIVLSNGPGNPENIFPKISDNLKLLMKDRMPIFGICLGHQLLGIAFGCDIIKLFNGHRGINHPVLRLRDNKIFITTQNHGFAVNIPYDKDDVEIVEISVHDSSVEGMRSKVYPIFSVQYHPEAGAGTSDCAYLFKEFLRSITESKNLKNNI